MPMRSKAPSPSRQRPRLKLYSKTRSWKAEGENYTLDELCKKALCAERRLKGDLKRTNDKVARLEDELDDQRTYCARAKKDRDG